MKEFAEWLGATPISVWMQEQYNWFIPGVQTIHIVAITVLVGSILMINMRLLAWSGTDQTMAQTEKRFGPWVSAALYTLLASGCILIIAEPVRELITFSFWLKMFLVAVGAGFALMFRSRLRKEGEELTRNSSMRMLAIVTLLIWVAVIFLGRLIAYDHIWGAWSPAEKA